MARRFGAMIGIVVVIALTMALMWWVYLHHQRSRGVPDEPALVSLTRPAHLT